MPTNDIIALDARLKAAWKERAPEQDESKFFESFAAEQALKDYYPSDDEVEAGRVGEDDDGGLDGIYFLINKRFVSDETEFDARVVTAAHLVLIQASREGSFIEKRVQKLNLLTEDLLDLSRGEGQLAGTYNEDVRSAIALFKDKYREYCMGLQQFSISYFYICKGDTGVINAGLHREKDRVTAKARELFSRASVSFNFVGAAELLDLVNRQPQKSYWLAAEAVISRRGQQAWVCLVPIVEYFNFIKNEKDDIRNELFEANVRDWQGMVPVNEAIKKSLEDKAAPEDFWWLNNGITILATSAPNQGGRLSVENPLIVNGLQTSRCIFDYVRSLKDTTKEDRNVLVRIIVTQQPENSDHIIKATNSQTVVPEFSLHMTEKVHRDIEAVLRNYNLYYDRRKNFYKNEGRRISQIVRPMTLAQTIMSVLLQRPDDARGRPTSVLNKDYGDVFGEKFPLELYANCALLSKKVDQFLARQGLTRNLKSNLRWYVAMVYAQALTGVNSPRYDDLSKLKIPQDDDALLNSLQKVKEAYDAVGGTDKVAKGPELVTKLGLVRKAPKAE